MSNAAARPGPEWIEPVMKAGYAARGLVYVLVGWIAVSASMGAADAEGPEGAMASLLRQPLGQVMLGLIALGLVAYAVWRVIEAWLDLENKGKDGGGLVARAGQFMAGVVHLLLAAYAGVLAARGASVGSGGGSTESITELIMNQPLGRIVIGLAGIVVLGVAVYHFVKAAGEKYKAHLRSTPFMRKLDPALKFGLAAHGVVIALIGLFLMYAARTHNPQQAGGFEEALRTIEAMPFGPLLLGVVGTGLLAFAAYCFVEARYRVLPATSGSSASTLAGS